MRGEGGASGPHSHSVIFHLVALPFSRTLSFIAFHWQMEREGEGEGACRVFSFEGSKLEVVCVAVGQNPIL